MIGTYSQYQALVCITNAITDRFHQQDFKTYVKLENLLIKAARGDDFHAEHDDVLPIYRKDFDYIQFQVQKFYRILKSEATARKSSG